MAKNYLSDDEVFGTKSYLSEEEVFGKTAPALAANEVEERPILGDPMGSDIGATIMASAQPSGDNRGIIQRVGDFFRPSPGTSVLDQPATGEELARIQQADINRRLSYGAGPIRSEVVQAADQVRSGRATGDQIKFKDQSYGDRVNKVVQEMDKRGEKSSAEVISSVRRDERQQQLEDQLEAEGRQRFGKENPILGSIAAGSAGMITGAINIPSVAADAFNKIAVNPVLRALGMEDLPDVPEAFGTEYLAKAASDYMPKIGKQSMEVAIKRDEFAPWLVSKLAANSPQIAQSLVAAFVPPLRAVLLPGMAGTAAGQSFAQGDDSRVAIAKGAVEYVSEKLPLGVFDRVGDVLKGMSPVKANTVLAIAGQRALQAGGAITANGLTNAIEETAAQLGGNVLDKYFQGKDIELTKGLAEAAVIGGVTGKAMSVPQAAAAATGYYEPERQIAREIDSAGNLFSGLGSEVSNAISVDMLRTEPGTSNLIRPAATVVNFTEPESPTAKAGLTPIVVPVPETTVPVPEVPAVGGINPETEQAFGLDKLRMGGANVGGDGGAGSATGAGGLAGGSEPAGGLGSTGPDLVGGLAGAVPGGAGVNGADTGAAVVAGGAASQPAATVSEPTEQWFGRKGDGYATEADAGQALPGRQRMFQELDWKVEQMPNGKYRLAGYAKEADLGTQTPQAIQAEAPGPEAAAQVAGATQGGIGDITTAAAGAPLELSDTERAGLRLAPTAPIREINSVNQALQKETGATFAPVGLADMSDSQRVASTVARMLGKTLTVMRQETGAGMLPNGMINRLGGQHLFVAEDADDAPLFVTTHEGYHGLPEDKRKVLNTALLDLFQQDKKGDFLSEFNYRPEHFEEEAPAMMAQAISKRADFWEQLRDKMGNKEFGEVAKIILAKFNEVLTGAKKQYGDDFVNKYITDVAKARDLLTTAYAESMQAQGLKPDASITMPMASERSRVVPKATEYQPERDNFAAPKTAEFLPGELVERAKNYITKFRAETAPVQISGADRIKAEGLLRPRMQAAQEAKLDYDQKILDIGERTGALGQMLAPIKGIKRAAEKLAVEEKFEVDNIKDLLRSTIVVDSYEDAPAVVDEIRKDFEVLRVKNRTDIELAGDDVQNEGFLPSGYGDVLVNVRMPNGTVGEIQVNVPEMLAAKGEEGHVLYEIERAQPEGSEIRQAVVDAQSEYYREAAAAAARRKKASSEGAPERGSASRSSSSPVASSSLKTRPSGNLTQSSPENEATKTQPAGKEAGTFIGSPDESSVSQSLYASNRVKTVGSYTYTTDDKGRIIVSGDAARIKFLTKKVANGIVNDQGVRFKAEDAKQVLKALKSEPKADASISSYIAGKLSLTPQELASTSLEYQTGLPKDRAFVAPLQGGIPEVVKFLEDRRRASGLRLLDISNLQDQDTLAKLIAAETLAAVRSSGSALEWYDETIAKTLAMAAVKYRELGADQNAQMAFRLGMAITSQGLNVENNLKFAMRQYDAYRNTGRFPEVGEGDSAEIMVKNFRQINNLLDEMKPDLLRRFLVTEFTIGELNQAGFDPGGELVDEKVLGSSILGPKIGFGFYSNLNGNFEPVTMDMWFMRTIGRLTGSLREFDAEKFSKQLDRFRSALDEVGNNGVFADQFDADLVQRARTENDAAIELARQVGKAHEKDFRANRDKFDAGERKKSELVYAAVTMVTSLDKPTDAPTSGMQRRLLREVVRKAVAEVERAYGQRIPPAAMQALIWYPEQELYKAMGVKLSVTSQDYAGATEKVLTEEGYDAKRLRTAAKSGSARIRQAAAGNAGSGAQGAGAQAGRAGALQGSEREQFIRQRYERTELAKEQVAPKRKGIVFEVAPDPNNELLTSLWRSLDAKRRREISERVAREIVPRALAEFDTDGIIAMQVGSYLDDTNPSFTLMLDKGDAPEVTKFLGFVLAQDSMMIISPKEFKGGEKVSALAIEVGNKTQAEIDSIYQALREIRVGDSQPVAGQSYSNGVMTILNYSDVATGELAILIDQKLNKAYSILQREVFASFPQKEEYDYASEANDGRGSRANLRRRARDLRSEATAALERELGDTGIQFSNRGGSDATGGGRDRGVGPQDVQAVTPSYGTPREGAASAVGYHYSTQPRTNLSSMMYGTGLRGAEMARLEGADPRLKQRIYFYIDRGTGINPESGVGGQAHRVNLQNLYDVDEDALRLRRDNEAFNDFESAVIDAGFDGYMVRDAGPSGNAVLLGKHSVPVEKLGFASRLTGERVAPAKDRVLSDAEKISANKALPSGQISGKKWAEIISRSMPEVYERLSDNPVWQSDSLMYRSNLAKELRAQPAFSNRRLPKVSPQSQLNNDIDGSTAALSRYIRQAEQGRQLPKLMIGRLPHVLNMLGARTQEFDISSSIVRKIFIEKHKDELGGITPRQLIEGIYRPAMVLKSKDGNPREFELVLPITNDQGAVIVPIKVSVDNTDPNGAVMSIYAKGVSISGGKTNEQVLMKRINDGNLLYIDPSLAKKALTGRSSGESRLNDNFISWPGVWPKLEKMITERRVKTDDSLMRWIGDNYKPSSSPQGWEDAPAFSNRARAEDKEVTSLFRELQDARGLTRVRTLERVDAHPMAETIRRIDSEFLDILERLDDAGLVKINCK